MINFNPWDGVSHAILMNEIGEGRGGLGNVCLFVCLFIDEWKEILGYI